MDTGDSAPRIVIRPNCNFSGRGAALIFCVMTLPVLVVAAFWGEDHPAPTALQR
ncbi:MAG: hypothetical protein OXE48_11305 [Gammaproteobacteria bacterium]|nr:hypothetical protein [Gammaproteobacteria bacterium]